MKSKKAVLVVSFGTSHTSSIDKCIAPTEQKISSAFADYDTKRAFISRVILKKLRDRDNIHIDFVTEALDSLAADGYTDVVIQPSFMINGEEYESLLKLIAPYYGSFKKLVCGVPLLTSDSDYQNMVKMLAYDIPFINDKNTAVVFLGHGTAHFANAAYAALAYRFRVTGHSNVFVGTVEGYPDFDTVLCELNASGQKKVILLPLLLVAGDHAKNDMAGGNEDSWVSRLKAAGYDTGCVLRGLGEYGFVQDMFVSHALDALGN